MAERWRASVVTGCALAAIAFFLVSARRFEPGAERIEQLVAALGAEDFEEREAAAKELAVIGESAAPALHRAAQANHDPELKRRAQRLFSEILLASKSTGMTLSLVAPGEFDMGSPETEAGRRPEETLHRVRISRHFLLGRHEVTQRVYQRVMGRNPSWFSREGEGEDKVAAVDLGRLPVERVSWFDALEFCNRLSELDGFPAFYELADVERVSGSIQQARVTVLGGHGYRLPTEAEWEYACRAGTSGPFHFGVQNSGNEANVKPVIVAGGYGGPSPKFKDLARTALVGGYPPNPWNLCDMHGNVAEWCWDWHDPEYYSSSPRTDPAGPSDGRQRIVRGGSWITHEASCRSASRFWMTPDERKEHVGFRVARTPRFP